MPSLNWFVVLLWSCVAFVCWRGGWAERTAILMLAANFAVTPLLPHNPGVKYTYFEPWVAGWDLLTFLALSAVAFRSDKFWPLWLTAMQGVVVLVHLGQLTGIAINAYTYKNSMAKWSYVQLLLLTLAALRHRSDRTRPHASGT